MTKKLILEITNSDGSITKKTYLKGLKSISNDFPQIEYHQWRSIYMNHNKIVESKLQLFNRQLLSKYKIYDVPIEI
jgi:hypothetical protein